MKQFDLNRLLRENIRQLRPYQSARTEYNGTAAIFLDANENAIGGAAGTQFQRYPDPLQTKLKQKIASFRGVDMEHIFLGNGSDEPIDLLIRAVCTPGTDNIIVTTPTYGMYTVSAAINDIKVREAKLTETFELNTDSIFEEVDTNTKIIFLCSPNNPSGNTLQPEAIESILTSFPGLVVIDEAYTDFAETQSWLTVLDNYPNLVVLQTFSKAWGMAGLRLGMAFANKEIISVLNKIKPPYNISEATQNAALAALDKTQEVGTWVRLIQTEKNRVAQTLQTIPCIKKIYASEANFLLVKMTDADALYQYLLQKGIVVRNRTKQPGCENCLRITIGSPQENDLLIHALQAYTS